MYIAIMEQSFYYKTVLSPLVRVQHAIGDIVYSTSNALELTCTHNQNRKDKAMSKYESFPTNHSSPLNKSTSRIENIALTVGPTQTSWFFPIEFL